MPPLSHQLSPLPCARGTQTALTCLGHCDCTTPRHVQALMRQRSRHRHTQLPCMSSPCVCSCHTHLRHQCSWSAPPSPPHTLATVSRLPLLVPWWQVFLAPCSGLVASSCRAPCSGGRSPTLVTLGQDSASLPQGSRSSPGSSLCPVATRCMVCDCPSEATHGHGAPPGRPSGLNTSQATDPPQCVPGARVWDPVVPPQGSGRPSAASPHLVSLDVFIQLLTPLGLGLPGHRAKLGQVGPGAGSGGPLRAGGLARPILTLQHTDLL